MEGVHIRDLQITFLGGRDSWKGFGNRRDWRKGFSDNIPVKGIHGRDSDMEGNRRRDLQMTSLGGRYLWKGFGNGRDSRK